MTTFAYRVAAVFGVIAAFGAIGGGFAILSLIFGIGDGRSSETLEALLGSAMMIVVFGVVGWVLYNWAERRSAEQGYLDVSDPAVLDALGVNLTQLHRDERFLEVAEDTLAESSLEEKIALRDEWAEDPEINDALIKLADQMIREEMGT